MEIDCIRIGGNGNVKSHSRSSVVAQHSTNGDSQTKWRMAKFDLSQIRDPLAIDKNCETNDYVREMTLWAKFRANQNF